MPWPETFAGNPRQNFQIFLEWPVIDHERLLVVTFKNNPEMAKKYSSRDFRLILSKKQRSAATLYKGDKVGKRVELREACGSNVCIAYPEISPKDEKALAKWLQKDINQTRNHMLPELADWVNLAIAAEVQRERDARGEIRAEDVALCPEELPIEMERYIRHTVLRDDKVLIYKKGNTHGFCYACGQNVRARNERFTQNQIVRCPNCGEIVCCYLGTSDRFKVDYVQNLISIQKGSDGKTVFLRQWHLERDPDGKWENIPAFLKEICRYAIRGNHVAKWQKEAKETWYYSSTRYSLGKWQQMQNVSVVYDGSYLFYCPPDWEQTVAQTSLQYCNVDEYITDCQNRNYSNVVRFLMDWARYPMIEKLWKAGYREIVHEKTGGLLGKNEVNVILWRKPGFREGIRFPVRLLKIRDPQDWKVKDLKKVVDLWERVEQGFIREQDLLEIALSNAEYEHIRDAMEYASVHKIIRYIENGVLEEQKQRDKRKGVWHGAYSTPQTFRDYIRDCMALHLDLTDRGVLFPKNLEAAHQRTISQVRYRANEVKREMFAQEVKRLRWMEWEHKDLIIRLPLNAEELIAEGKALHHCVAGYADRMANGATTIFLIRKKADPDRPFFTLEWLNGHVQQCRTVQNKDYHKVPDVKDFVDRWVQRVSKNRRKTA